jgi:hypothetical protein
VIVNYVLASGDIRPMIVVQSFPDTPQKLINGIVFRDGSNDDRKDGGRGELVILKQSVYYDAQKRPNTWHEVS